MREKIIEMTMKALEDRDQFFIREEDIQLYLANIYLNSGLFDNVFIEYHIPSSLIFNYPWNDINNLYIDIVIEKNSKFFPIEIKFKTVSQELPFNIFGESTVVKLGHHGAQNIGCYDFWKDVKRIEMFEDSFKNVERGIVLFVTNDQSYLKSPLNDNVGYAPFSIHQGRSIAKKSILNWNKQLSISVGRPEISTNYEYLVNWNSMKKLKHHYILI